MTVEVMATLQCPMCGRKILVDCDMEEDGMGRAVVMAWSVSQCRKCGGPRGLVKVSGSGISQVFDEPIFDESEEDLDEGGSPIAIFRLPEA